MKKYFYISILQKNEVNFINKVYQKPLIILYDYFDFVATFYIIYYINLTLHFEMSSMTIGLYIEVGDRTVGTSAV